MKHSEEEDLQYILYIGMKKMVFASGHISTHDSRVTKYAVTNLPVGFQGGLVCQLGEASEALQALISKVVNKGASENLSVWVVLGNSKLNRRSFESSIYFHGDSRVLSAHEVRAVIHQTKSVATLPLSECVLQSLPESFLVDDVSGVKSPLGLEARRLGVNLNLYTMNFQEFKNISKLIDVCELEVESYLPKCLCVSEAVLTNDEKRQSTLLIDLTSENTELCYWKDGGLREVLSVPLGLNELDVQLAQALSIERQDAENLKKRYATFLPLTNPDELVPLFERGGQVARQIKRSDFQAIWMSAARGWYERLLVHSHDFLRTCKAQNPLFVFTGGGAAVDGLCEFLLKEFSVISRVGASTHVEAPTDLLVDLSMTHFLGMFRWLASPYQEHMQMTQQTGFLQKTIASARNWFLEYF